MKRYVLMVVFALMCCLSVWSGEINEENFEENARKAQVSFIGEKEVITEVINSDVFISDSKVVLMATINGDIYLSNSVLTLQENAQVKGIIYAQNSRLVSADLTLNAPWFVVEDDDSRFTLSPTDDDKPVRRQKVTVKYIITSLLNTIFMWAIFLALVYVVFYVARRHLFFFENDITRYWIKYIAFAIPAVFAVVITLGLLSVMCVTIILIPVFIALLAYTTVSGFAFFLSYFGMKIKRTSIDSSLSYLYGALMFLGVQVIRLMFNWVGAAFFTVIIDIANYILLTISFTFGVRYFLYLISKKRRIRLVIGSGQSE